MGSLFSGFLKAASIKSGNAFEVRLFYKNNCIGVFESELERS